MGIDAALAEFFQADAGHEPLARVALRLDLEFLAVDVERTGRVLSENAVARPIAQRHGGAGITVIVRGIGGRFLVENQANHVIRAAVVERLLQGGIDHVVRRRDHVAEVADAGEVITKAAKGLHFGHGGYSCKRLGRAGVAVVAERSAKGCLFVARRAGNLMV